MEETAYKKFRNLREEIGVIQVVELDGPVKTRGHRAYATCPSCKKSDAFSVVLDKNYCYCYRCKFHAGNSVQYFMKTRNLEFKDACRKMEEIF